MTTDLRIDAEWITRKSTRAVMAALKEAWFVGGCVRNALMGLPVADIDIATPLLPEEVVRRVEAAGLRSVPTGIGHGTVTVIAKGEGFEVTTFRRDVETDGRRASVAYSTDMIEDAARRDFTMNAIYAAADGSVVDPLGGLPDLHARHLRFVGHAADRIREDYLRSLRFFRFAAHYAPDRPFDHEALAAIAANLDGLGKLSAERVTAELVKLLAAPEPTCALAEMARIGILQVLLPDADPGQIAALVALEKAAGLAPEPICRLAILVSDVSGLRLSRKEADLHAFMRRNLDCALTPVVLAFKGGARAAIGTVLARGALGKQPLPEDWCEEIARGALAEFPIRAADLAPLSGPELGQEIGRLREIWLAGGARLDREALLSLRRL